MEIRRTTHATRQIRKFPADVREAVNDAIDSLEEWPHVMNVKKLQGRDEYRLRIGRYRIVFSVTGTVIWVNEVLIRDDRTYS